MAEWHDGGEVAKAKAREHKGTRHRNYAVVAVLAFCFVAAIIISDIFAPNRGKRDDLAAVAASVSAEQARWNAAHPLPEAGASHDTVSDTVDAVATGTSDADEAGRAIILNLTKNPKALKPTAIAPPDDVEPHTTYEYRTTELGDVVQWRIDARRWDIFLANRDRPEIFAPRTSLKTLDKIGTAVAWWKVTDGPFRGAFIMATPGGIELMSHARVCDADKSKWSMTPSVDRECGR